MKGKVLLVIGTIGLLLLTTGILPVTAAAPETILVSYRYPVKFVCGVYAAQGQGEVGVYAPLGGGDVNSPLASGRYHTSINIYNPSLAIIGATTNVGTVTFGKKFAVSSYGNYDDGRSGTQDPGPATNFYKAVLKANLAFEINCTEISNILELPIGGAGDVVDGGYLLNGNDGAGYSYIEGFVVIMSPVELDVTAVYTARPNGSSVQSMNVQAISAKTQRAYIQIFPMETQKVSTK